MADIVEIPKKDEPAGEFAIGDVVTLRSGGVKVTVRRLTKVKGATMVNVDWMDAADTPCSADYDARQLMIAPAEEE
jgi:uncharacterized protein YodC (DUF2158 family)